MKRTTENWLDQRAPRDYREFRERIEAHGYRVVSGGKHLKIVRENGTFVAPLSFSPSDHRAARNMWRQFVRKEKS